MLIIFGGLPGTGKTSIAKRLANQIKAVYLRIDTIEQGILENKLVKKMNDIGPAGYDLAGRIAADNLKSGMTVVVDCVNPIPVTRENWKKVAHENGAKAFEIEIICSDKKEHRRRIETREPDIDRFDLPSWDDVLKREYETWESTDLTIDTAVTSVEKAVNTIRKTIGDR